MSAATTTSELPTVLLVHGAWHRPQHYTALTTALQSHYFTVLTPSLESTGTTHAIDTKTHLDDSRAILSILQPALDAGKQIIAVAHSYGTLPLAEALAGQSAEERKERGEIGGVVGVVFIAPLPVLKKGVSMLEAGGGEWASGFFHGVTVSERFSSFLLHCP